LLAIQTQEERVVSHERVDGLLDPFPAAFRDAQQPREELAGEQQRGYGISLRPLPWP
jgi:hypothetical protein